MNRIITVSILILMIVACQPQIKQGNNAPDFSHSNPRCEPDSLKNWIGQDIGLFDPAAGENIRVITPGSIVTNDYQKNRLNLYLGQDSLVQRAECG